MAADGQTLPQYRSISSLAILALVLGIASSLALVNPLLLALPLATIALSLFALRQIAANPDIFSGRGMTLAALFLAIFFLVFAPARLWMRFQVIRGHAEELATTFLDLLQHGKLHEAHQLANIKYISPSPDDTMDPTFDPKKLTLADFAKFQDTETIKNIKAIDSKFTYEAEGVEPSKGASDADVLVLRYKITPDPATKKPPFRVWITIVRIRQEKGTPTWKLTDFKHQFKKSDS
jgi:hypothetical protein